MNLAAFYDKCQLLPENERRWVDVFYRTVIDVFGEEDQDFFDLSKVCSLFYGNGLGLSKAQYYRKRKLVCGLYDWLFEQGAVTAECVEMVYALKMQDVVLDKELYRYYFRDLEEVLNFITLVGSSKGLGDCDDMLNFKAMAVLIWNQIELVELQNLKKEDLLIEEHAILVGERHISIDKRYIDLLKRFADLDVHRGFPSRKQQVYMTSPYLFRSARQVNLTPNNVQKALGRFNLVAADFGKELSSLSLKRNGIFERVYNSDDEKTAGILIREITGCDTAFAFGYKEFYERWKQLIVGGDTR